MKKVIFPHVVNYACKNRGTEFRKGFSLVEMLMALLVASLLLAALAPVMTRKMTGENLMVSGSLNKAYHDFKIFKNPTAGDASTFEFEDYIIPKDDENYATRFNAIIVSGGGGGAGAGASLTSGSKTLDYKTGAVGGSTSSTTSTVALPSYSDYKFNKYTDSIELTLISGAGGGGAGVGNIKDLPKFDQDVCNQFGNGRTDTTGHTGSASSPLMIYDSASGLCISAYNQISSGTRTSPSPSQPYCTTYAQGSFKTPICMKDGAFKACQDFSLRMTDNQDANLWRLPTEAEQKKWTASFVSKTVANKGIGGCSHSSVSGVPLCPWQSISASKQYHFPYHIWSSTPYTHTSCSDSGKAYRTHGLDGTSWAVGWFCAVTRADYYAGYTQFGSVRCVLGPDETATFHSFSGGAGGGGLKVQVKIPEAVIERAIKDSKDGFGVLRVYAGNGGKNSTGGGSGYNGQATMVAVYPSTGSGVGAKIWHFLVPGGSGGKDGSNTAGGAGGKSAGTKCSYYDLTAPVPVVGTKYNVDNTNLAYECSSLPAYVSHAVGDNGNTGAMDATLPSSGGNGNGASQGGNGSYCVNSKTAKCTDGFATTGGGGGSVNMTYKTRIPGVGGSGGGGGSVISLLNMPIPADRTIKVGVGAGGLGGSAGAEGKKGGDSYIIVNGVKYVVEGGTGGGKVTDGSPNNLKYNMTDAQVAQYSRGYGNVGTAGVISNNMQNAIHAYNGDFAKGTDGTVGLLDLPNGRASGGNGGINELTSLASELPCGMYNAGEMKYKDTTLTCGGLDVKIPTPLTHGAANITDMAEMDNYLQFLTVAGATGGGGGAWDKNAASEAAGGGTGSSGYVVLYWGDSYNWRQNSDDKK